MDYARFNYIAQPGDKNIRFIRQMELMIIMLQGVPIIPNSISTDGHIRQVDFGKNRKSTYKYGKQSSSFDPTSQTEDIGNSMKASSYGLKTCNRCGSLSEWTSDVTNNYEDLDELYKRVVSARVGMYAL
jgi:hypothetical protein